MGNRAYLRLRQLDALQSLPRKPHPGAMADIAAAADGRTKLWIVSRLLALRADDPQLFRDGSYEPLEVQGLRERHVLAFMRRHQGRVLVVLVVRLFAILDRGEASRSLADSTVWGDTEVVLTSAETEWHFEDCLTGASHVASGGRLSVATVLGVFPGAALVGRTAR